MNTRSPSVLQDAMKKEVIQMPKTYTAPSNGNASQEKFHQLRSQIDHALELYREHPEQTAELFAFQAKFYRYSLNNTLLIHQQNPHVTFVASFDKWKKLGYAVKRGQRGIKIVVPAVATFFQVEDEFGRTHWKQLKNATEEERAKIKAGEIVTVQRRHYTVGHVYDISQTTCPPEDYPKLYSPGFHSEQHAALYNAVKSYAESIGVAVLEKDLQSISLRGTYSSETNSITISDKLQDTERLSTLTHELGHAILYKYSPVEASQPLPIREMEADAISISLQAICGIELTQARIDHFHQHTAACQKLDNFSLDDVLRDISDINNTVQKGIEPFLAAARNAIDEQKEKIV